MKFSSKLFLFCITPVVTVPITFSTSCSKNNTFEANINKNSFITEKGVTTASATINFNKSLKSTQTITIEPKIEYGQPIKISNQIVNESSVDLILEIEIDLTKEYDKQFSAFELKLDVNENSNVTYTKTFTNLVFQYTPLDAPIDVPEKNLIIENNVLKGFTGIISDKPSVLKVPDTVTEIISDAFNQDTAKVKMPSNVKFVKIPSSVTKIGDRAFQNCTSLLSLNLSTWNTVPSWTGQDMFKGVNNYGTVTLNNKLSTETKENIYTFLFDKLPGRWTFGEYGSSYIYNRTFSVAAYNSESQTPNTPVIFGTMWILEDSTPDITNDYSYYLATNWHVTHGFDNLSADTFVYADTSLSEDEEGIIDLNNYEKFHKYSPEQTSSTFEYESVVKGTHYIPCIDMYVIDATFNPKPNSSIAKKLDKINTFRAEHNYINKFEDYTSDLSSKEFKVGGYPYRENLVNSGGKYECESIKNLTWVDWADTQHDLSYAHPIGDPDISPYDIVIPGGTEQFYNWDISPQFVYGNQSQYKSKKWMSGGASGSMLLDEDYKVAGIYWGGMIDRTADKFWPQFCQFKSKYKNFIEKYIK